MHICDDASGLTTKVVLFSSGQSQTKRALIKRDNIQTMLKRSLNFFEGMISPEVRRNLIFNRKPMPKLSSSRHSRETYSAWKLACCSRGFRIHAVRMKLPPRTPVDLVHACPASAWYAEVHVSVQSRSRFRQQRLTNLKSVEVVDGHIAPRGLGVVFAGIGLQGAADGQAMKLHLSAQLGTSGICLTKGPELLWNCESHWNAACFRLEKRSKPFGGRK